MAKKVKLEVSLVSKKAKPMVFIDGKALSFRGGVARPMVEVGQEHMLHWYIGGTKGSVYHIDVSASGRYVVTPKATFSKPMKFKMKSTMEVRSRKFSVREKKVSEI